jgi:8-oxo-dGTP pyrophosphatase MutT (NUDIX family)
MPDVYVFPGGALDLADLNLAENYLPDFDRQALQTSILTGRDSHLLDTYPKNELFTPSSKQGLTRLTGIPDNFLPSSRQKLAHSGLFSSQRELGAGLVLCALRELYEETGLHLAPDVMENSINIASQDHPFSSHFLPSDQFIPLFENIIFLSRAITPPGIKQRFDTRFFLHDYEGPDGWTGDGDNELVKTAWVSFEEALSLKLHPMTRVILEDVNEHLSSPSACKQPNKVSFYQYSEKRFQIEAIEMETPS